MKYKSLFPWLLLDMLLFTVLNIIFITALRAHYELLGFITPMRLFILGLAVYRGANIISNEFVTTPIRAPFVHEVERNGEMVQEPIYEDGFKGFLGSLLYCPSCVGVWLAMLITYSYVFFPAATSVITLFLALSALERFFAFTAGKLKSR